MSDLHRGQVAGTKHGHGIADSDETVAVNRHDAGELPATALKVLLECDSVGDAEQLADMRTRFAGTGELAGGLSDAQHCAGGQRVQRGEFDGNLFSQVSRLQAQGFQRGPVHDEDLPVAPGFFLAVHIAFQPEIHQGPGPADGLRPLLMLDEEVQTDHSATDKHRAHAEPLFTSYSRSPGRSNSRSRITGPGAGMSTRTAAPLPTGMNPSHRRART